MTTTYKGARDSMLGLIHQTNLNQTSIPYVPEMRTQGFEKKESVPSDKFWLYAHINTLVAGQKTLSSNVKAPGKRRYEEAGLVVIELFIPRSESGSWPMGEKWAEEMRSIFRGRKLQNGVWFKNAVIKEVPNELEFFRINVIAEFNYSEIY